MTVKARKYGALNHAADAAGEGAARPLVGVWDQWCVMSERPYVKMVPDEEGELEPQVSMLDLESCRQIVRNFAAAKDDLPCTLGHQKGTVEKARFKVATYSAMATWHQGRVVEFGSHSAAIAPPTEADLPRPDNGDPPEDGNYVFRSRVTELGAACIEKAAVGKTSPEFVMNGLDQHAQELGAQALGLAWTDAPFLDGCEINLMERVTGGDHPDKQVICLVPPSDLAAALALPGGSEPADFHCTLAVLMPPHPAAAAVVQALCHGLPPLEGTVSGPARFAGPAADVLCALVDCPGLGALRQGLVAALEAAGATVLKDHDFQPHITLAYVTPAEPLPARIEPMPVRFTELVCQLGSQKLRHSLGGSQQETDAMKKKMQKFEMEAGCKEGETDEQRYSKAKSHFGKKAFMEAGVADADSPTSALAKFAKHMSKDDDDGDEEDKDRHEHEAGDATAHSGQQHAEPDADNKLGLPGPLVARMDSDLLMEMTRRFEMGELADQKAVMAEYSKAHLAKFGKAFEYEDPIVVPGAPTRVDEPPPNNHVVDGRGGHAMERGGRAAPSGTKDTIAALSTRVQSQDQRLRQYEQNEIVRKRDDKLKAAQQAVNEAWSAGQIVLKPGEKTKDAKARFLRLYMRGPEVFSDALAAPGTESTIEQTRGRLSSGGLPVNFEREVQMEADRPDEEMIRLCELKRKDNPKLSALKAAREVAMERPDLATAYRRQSKEALFQ